LPNTFFTWAKKEKESKCGRKGGKRDQEDMGKKNGEKKQGRSRQRARVMVKRRYKCVEELKVGARGVENIWGKKKESRNQGSKGQYPVSRRASSHQKEPGSKGEGTKTGGPAPKPHREPSAWCIRRSCAENRKKVRTEKRLAQDTYRGKRASMKKKGGRFNRIQRWFQRPIRRRKKAVPTATLLNPGRLRTERQLRRK